jgi:hypothetical protein
MTWAWTVALPPAPKLVLMALADEANDHGYCIPTHSEIAQKCSINERSVRRMIGVLCAAGYVVVKQRFHNRARTSNGYQLIVGHPRTNWPGGRGTVVRGDRTPLSGGIGHGCPGAPDTVVRATTTKTVVCLKPPPQLPQENASDEAETTAKSVCGGGDLCFPKALSTTQRRAIERQLNGLEACDAQQVLDELAGRMASTTVRNPVGYCAALVASLKRGTFRLELGLVIAERRAAQRHREDLLSEHSAASESAEIAPPKGIPQSVRAMLDRFRRPPPPEQAEVHRDGHPTDTPAAPDDADG